MYLYLKRDKNKISYFKYFYFNRFFNSLFIIKLVKLMKF